MALLDGRYLPALVVMQAETLSSTRQFSDYISLTKPRIGLLAVVTTFAGMWLATGGLPDLVLVLFTLVGTAGAAGAAGALNNYLDRDLDQKMERTSTRPLPSGRLDGYEALALGILLTIASVIILYIFANLLTALLALIAILFYAPVYTLWLKRNTPLCTVLGGITGAIPPVMGWTAVSGEIGIGAIILFAILFFWQPPHFWALALLRTEEYRNAGVPMLPVVHGDEMTRRQIALYAAVLLPISLMLYLAGVVGWVYVMVAMALGIGFVLISLRSLFDPENDKKTSQVFFYSLIYLTLLCIMMFVDATPGI